MNGLALAAIDAQPVNPRIVPEWLTVELAAAHISASPKTVRRMISSGALTAYRPRPGCLRISRVELDALMRASANGRTKRKHA